MGSGADRKSGPEGGCHAHGFAWAWFDGKD
jgi:hypothetical protein